MKTNRTINIMKVVIMTHQKRMNNYPYYNKEYTKNQFKMSQLIFQILVNSLKIQKVKKKLVKSKIKILRMLIHVNFA